MKPTSKHQLRRGIFCDLEQSIIETIEPCPAQPILEQEDNRLLNPIRFTDPLRNSRKDVNHRSPVDATRSIPSMIHYPSSSDEWSIKRSTLWGGGANMFNGAAKKMLGSE